MTQTGRLSDEELRRLRGDLGCMAFSQSGGGFLDAGILADLDGALGELLSLRSAGRWIPVEERLPEEHQPVLAIPRAFPEPCEWMVDQWFEDGDYPSSEGAEFFKKFHKCWQPLPASPEGKKE